MRNLGLMDPAFLGGLGGLSLYDPDAAVYMAAVEAADGQALETGVRDAINAFVLGCKADGIWNAIKASCILAGARTLAGALVPLVGAAPTSFNFVAGDYNRKTGLVGNGSTKYLNSNRANNADPQNSKHVCIFSTSPGQNLASATYIGTNVANVGDTFISLGATGFFTVRSNNATNAFTGSNSNQAGLVGQSRSSSSQFIIRANKVDTIANNASNAPSSSAIGIFARGNNSNHSDARLAFYSIGESLNLALLDARVTALVNALAVAIP
jgi:hypothetical protein